MRRSGHAAELSSSLWHGPGRPQVGDVVSAGASYGRVRGLRDDLGKTLDSAGPSIAVQMVGLNSTPMAGQSCGLLAWAWTLGAGMLDWAAGKR